MVRLLVVVPLLLLSACPPPASTPAPSEKPVVAPSPDVSERDQPTFVAKGSEPPPPPTAGTGVNFRDPAWYRKSLFPDSTVVKEGRSPRDEAGYFASQMTLQLADGTTRDECEKTVTDAVAADVLRLERAEKDGRVTLTGDAKHYTVTLICGEAKGKMTVYLSYRWTSTPE